VDECKPLLYGFAVPGNTNDRHALELRVEGAALDCWNRFRTLGPVGPVLYWPISVYRFPRSALTLYPQLCMGIQPGARVPARSADALSAALYEHFTQAIYRHRPIARHVILHILDPLCSVKWHHLMWRALCAWP